MGRYQAYSEYKDSDIEMLGPIPSSWNTRQVRHLLKDGADGIKIGPFGSALKLEDMVDDGIRVYGQENVIQRDFNLGSRRISEAKFSEMTVYKVIENDILITMMGTSGKCIIVPKSAEIGIIDSHLLRVRVKENEILPSFFRLLIDESFEIANQIKIAGKGSIMHGLNSSIVKSLQLPLPNIQEQISILQFLDHETAKIDTLIEKQQQLIQLLKEKRQAVISHAVTKGLNPNAPMKDSGVEWLGEVPEHWKVASLKYLVSAPIIDGPHLTPVKRDEGVPFISAEAVSQGYINFDKKWGYISEEDHKVFSKRYSPQRGDILVVKLGATTGVSAIVETDEQFNVWVPLATIRSKNSVPSKFIFYLLQSVNVRDAFQLSWTFGTQQTLGLGTLANLSFPVPSKDEALKIVEYIESKIPSFDELVSRSEESLSLLKERRTALVSAAVTGKIDVRNFVSKDGNKPEATTQGVAL